jgi:alkylation response protein AidB-like acyl-CoA dehydrogenase
VNLSLTQEQEMLRDAAADALSRLDTLANARAALDDAPLLDLWPTACEAGWAGLLVAEERGGAGLGVFDAMLVLEQCGKRLAGAGLLGHLPATLVLDRAAAAGDALAAELLPALAEGTKRAAFVPARPPAGAEAWTVDGRDSQARRSPAPTLRSGAVTGLCGFVPDAAGADVLVVPVSAQDGALAVAVIAAGAAEVEAVTRYDATRPLGHVRLDSSAASVLALPDAAATTAGAWYLAQALLAADALGLSHAMLDMSVAYAKDRYAFGRQIGSYQSIKHQIVDILRHAETTRNLCFYAGLAADDRPEDLALAASGARFAGEQAADYATRTCIAVHGGIGATWEHDAPLYWRRAQLSRLLLGGIDDAGDRVAEEIVARARARARNT